MVLVLTLIVLESGQGDTSGVDYQNLPSRASALARGQDSSSTPLLQKEVRESKRKPSIKVSTTTSKQTPAVARRGQQEASGGQRKVSGQTPSTTSVVTRGQEDQSGSQGHYQVLGGRRVWDEDKLCGNQTRSQRSTKPGQSLPAPTDWASKAQIKSFSLGKFNNFIANAVSTGFDSGEICLFSRNLRDHQSTI